MSNQAPSDMATRNNTAARNVFMNIFSTTSMMLTMNVSFMESNILHDSTIEHSI